LLVSVFYLSFFLKTAFSIECNCNLKRYLYTSSLSCSLVDDGDFLSCDLDLSSIDRSENITILIAHKASTRNLHLINDFQTSLSLIMLSQANVHEIPMLNRLANLATIYLDKNKITHLDKSDYFPASLEVIHLQYNSIEFILKDCFLPLVHLKYLDLRFNKLASLDLQFGFSLGAEEVYIDFSRNLLNGSMLIDLAQVTATPESRSAKSEIKFRTVSKHCTVIPDISNPNHVDYNLEVMIGSNESTNAIVLFTYANQSRTIKLVGYSNLDSLDVTYFSHFGYILSHDFSRLDLEVMPNISQLFAGSKWLNLNVNMLTELRDASLLPDSLERLSAENNLIEYLDAAFFTRFKQLSVVLLTNNRLKSLQKLQFNSNYLVEINLRFNLLENLQILEFLNENLLNNVSINLASNNLSKVPQLKGALKSLASFNLASQIGQRLTKFNFDSLSGDEEPFRINLLNLANNSIDSLDSHICLLNEQLVIERLDLTRNDLNSSVYCRLLNKLTPLDELNIILFPQNEGYLACHHMTDYNYVLLINKLIYVNCEERTRVEDGLKCYRYVDYNCSGNLGYDSPEDGLRPTTSTRQFDAPNTAYPDYELISPSKLVVSSSSSTLRPTNKCFKTATASTFYLFLFLFKTFYLLTINV
jgi:hypothetical protein